MSRTARLFFTVLGFITVPATIFGQFNPPRAMPMPFAEKRKVDLLCDNDGSGSSSAKRASNRAKNNFSAPAPAISLTFANFVALQQKIDADPATFKPDPDGDGYMINDRDKLKNLITVNSGGVNTTIGEGKRVVLTAFVMSARHANSWPLGGNGESVNCNSSRMNRNDIHIEVVEIPGHLGDSTKRLTAEMSPHYRPMIWERFDTNDLTAPEVVDVVDINDNKPLAGKPGIKALVGKKARIYGHLFFDDNHRPCFNTPCGRLSTWEIHPVYSIDIEENNEWVPFHEWAAVR